MPQNPNTILYAGNTYNIDAVIKGQTPLGMYDPLKQMVYQPDIRRNKDGKVAPVLPYSQTSLWGLFSQLQAKWGSDKKVVKASTYFYKSYTVNDLRWKLFKLRREWLRKIKGYK